MQLATDETNTAPVEILRFMYDRDRPYHARCLNGRVLVTSPERVKQGLEAIGPYNQFRPDTVFNALDKHVLGMINFRPETAGIYLGREGSPVIYVPSIYCDLDHDVEDLVSAARQAGRDAHADEVSSDWHVHSFDGDTPEMPDVPSTVRLWWD